MKKYLLLSFFYFIIYTINAQTSYGGPYTYNITFPPGVTSAQIDAYGGGGGGGNSGTQWTGAAGGGGGAFARKNSGFAVTSGNCYTITVGGGGGAQGAGGLSSVVSGSTIVQANGGAAASGNTLGAGGSAPTGDVKNSGGSGVTGVTGTSNQTSKGGGGGGGPTSAGGNASGSTGGTSGGGSAGVGGAGVSGDGSNGGGAYGGGGGGGRNASGGAGGAGGVIITFGQTPNYAFGSNQWIGYVYNSFGGATYDFIDGRYIGKVVNTTNFNTNFSSGAASGNVSTSLCSPPATYFHIRYRMTYTVATTGYYRVTAGADDGYRFQYRTSPSGGWSGYVINNWADGGYRTTSTNILLTAGDYDFEMDYYQGSGGDQASFNICYMGGGNLTSYGSSGGAWNVYTYNAGNYTYDAQTYTGTFTSGSSSTNSASLSLSDVTVSSGVGGGVCGTSNASNTNQSIRALLTNSFTKGIYTASIGSDDNYRLYINGSLSLNGTCCAGVSGTVALNGSANLEYQGNNTGGAGGYNATFTALSPLSGTLSVSQTCGTNTGTLSWSSGRGYYLLESSTDLSSWSTVSGYSETNTVAASSGTWSSLAPSATTYYRVRSISNSSTVYSNIVAIVNSGATTTGNITIANNITLGGTLTLTGDFTLNNGFTITVQQGCPLVINAANITINGIINGDGAGTAGGTGGGTGDNCNSSTSPYCNADNNAAYPGYSGRGGSAASGSGAGSSGNAGTIGDKTARNCADAFCNGGADGVNDGGPGGGAGGGGAYGGNGGAGKTGGNGWNRNGSGASPTGGTGAGAGSAFGSSDLSVDVISMGGGGSGAGGGGGGMFCGAAGQNGGNGGGSISLIACNSINITSTGSVTSKGNTGGNGGNGSVPQGKYNSCGNVVCTNWGTYDGSGGGGAGGGGGSGGGILIKGFGAVIIKGTLSVKGGNGGTGGSAGDGSSQAGDGGGAGGGGRIKIISNPCNASNDITPSSTDITSGSGGTGRNTGNGGNAGSNNISLVHSSYSALAAGSITTTPIFIKICSGSDPASGYNANVSTGGANNTALACTSSLPAYQYQWYVTRTACGSPNSATDNTVNAGWSGISGVTTQDISAAQLLTGINTVGTNTTPGIYTFQRRTQSGSCYAWTTVVSVVIFPSAPTVTALSNTCNAALANITAVTDLTASGFTAQYAVQAPGGSFSTYGTLAAANALLTNTSGCWAVKARYVLTTGCGGAANSEVPPTGCVETTINAVVFPSAPSITALSNTCNAALANITAVTAISGFTAEYAVQAPGGSLSSYGTLAAANALLTNTSGCWTIKARYKLTSTCGGTAADAVSGTVACQETTINAVVFPATPTIVGPTANTCNAALTAISALPAKTGFTAEYSVIQPDGTTVAYTSTLATANAALTNTPGCFTIKARYTLTAACASTTLGTVGTGSCTETVINAVVFPASPTIVGPTSDVCNTALTAISALPVITGFTAEYSVAQPNGTGSGQYNTNLSTINALLTNTTGCFTIIARYKLTAACGSTAINTVGTGSCVQTSINAVVFPASPTIVGPTVNTCNAALTAISAITAPFGFTTEYSVTQPDGTTSGYTTTLATANALLTNTLGCFTIKARFKLTAACGTTAINSVGTGSCAETVINAVVFPSAPSITALSNTCNAALANITAVTAISGFTAEYAVQAPGGSLSSYGTLAAANALLTNTSGCWTVKARYKLTADCGTTTLANAVSGTLACQESTINAVVFPAAPTITATSNTCAGTAFSLPSVSTVTGFTTQYSIDGGTYTSSPSSSTVGCHTVTARYILTSTCGGTTAGTASSTSGCIESNSVSITIFPAAPTLTATSNTCSGTAFSLPSVSAVTGFTVQYSIDGGTYATSPSNTTEGCHTVKARYVLTSACGSTSALATAPAGCLESNTVSVTIFPTKPTLTATANTCEGTAFALPSVTDFSGSGFTTEYNIDGSGYTSTPTVPVTTGCHTVQARYVLTANCGANVAGSTGTVACLESNTVSIVIFPTAPTLTPPSNTCAGTGFTLPSVTGVAGFTVQYSVNGGTYATSPTVPTTVGCHTVKARYVLNSACGTNAANSTAPAGCLESATVSVVIFPAAPSISATANTCEGTAFALPGVTTVSGFTKEYNIDGSGYTASPTVPTTPGCHTVQARYTLTAVCGTNAAGLTAPVACLESNIVSIVIFPTAPTLTPPTNTCEGTAFTLPSVSSVTDFTVQYSIDGGTYSTSPSIPTTAGCHTVKARYVLTSTCGSNAANATAPAVCLESAAVSVVIFPTAPVISTPANTCAGTTFTLPSVSTVADFTVKYSIDGGTFSASPTLPTTAGTYTVEAQYFLTSACGSNAANSTGTGACGISNLVSVTIYPLPSLTDPAPSSQTLCQNGTPTDLSVTASSGTPSTYTYQWYRNTTNSTTGGTAVGTNSNTYTPVTTALGTYYYYCVVTQPESGCTFKTALTASVTVVALPVAGTLAKTPNSTDVCDGANVSAALTAGSGGSGIVTDVLEYRTDDGTGFTAWAAYTSGSNISTTGLITVEIQTYRTATGSGCTTSSTNTVSWTVNQQPVSGTLAKTPNTTNVCEGTSVSATLTAGSGGAGAVTDILEYRYNGTGGWTTYTSGSSLSTAGKTQVEVRTYRTATGTNCTSPGATNTVSWIVDVAPVATPSSQLYTCDGTASLLATGISSGATVSWQYVSGPVSPTGTSTSNPLLVTFSSAGTGVYNLLGSTTGCTNVNLGTVNIVMPTTSSTSLASTASCAYCEIQDGNVRTIYNSAGELIAKIEDDPLVIPDQLGQTEVCVRLNGSVQYVTDNDGYQQPYLQRQWTVHPINNSRSILTLYFKNSELTALQTAANGGQYQFSGYSGLYVTKYPGGSNGTFTAPASLNGESVPALFSSYGSDHKIEMEVSTYSTFYVHPALFPFAPLPVELISFTGWNEGIVNKLQWITASESNTAKFIIEKHTANGSWVYIGEKTAAGNSNQRLTYDFTDNDPVIGDNYYRLKILDLDGSFSYSNIINIPISEVIVNNITRIYPNPTGGLLNVEIQSTSLYDTKILVYDVIGKKVFDKSSSLVKGLNTLQFDFSQLAKGTYVIQFSDKEGKLHSTKFVKE